MNSSGVKQWNRCYQSQAIFLFGKSYKSVDIFHCCDLFHCRLNYSFLAFILQSWFFVSFLSRKKKSKTWAKNRRGLILFLNGISVYVTFLLAQKSNQKKAAANETARCRRWCLDIAFVLLWWITAVIHAYPFVDRFNLNFLMLRHSHTLPTSEKRR